MQRLELNQNIAQTLRQEQVMAPQQIQALEILLATIPELEQKINEELAENPTLELIGPGGESLVGNPVEGESPGGEDGRDEAAALAAEKDEALATLIQLEQNWRDYAPGGGYHGQPAGDDADEHRQYMFDSLVAETSLQDLLQEQLRQVEDLDPKTREICAQVIGSIDETGYLRTHPSDLAITSSTDLSAVRKAIGIVQGFDPPGVGARDLRECLLLQLERNGDRDSLTYKLVDKHLDKVGRNQIPAVAKALRIPSSHVYELLRRIRRLAPFPGSLVTDSQPEFVYPEVFIEKDEQGRWQVRTNREFRPRLRLSRQYMKLLEDPNTDPDVRKYIRDKVTSSKLLMRAIDQRQSTIEQISWSLLKYQRGFFEHGIEHMHPLVMSQVADDIGVHETTVSRAIANKFVQTPHGLMKFRHFFATGYRGRDGEEVSSHAIKEKLQSLINEENPKKPLSDQKLSDLLKKQGFRVARRTVAKYREELDILPSHLRRNY